MNVPVSEQEKQETLQVFRELHVRERIALLGTYSCAYLDGVLARRLGFQDITSHRICICGNPGPVIAEGSKKFISFRDKTETMFVRSLENRGAVTPDAPKGTKEKRVVDIFGAIEDEFSRRNLPEEPRPEGRFRVKEEIDNWMKWFNQKNVAFAEWLVSGAPTNQKPPTVVTSLTA